MRWRLFVSLHRFLCVLPSSLPSSPSPFFPAVSWGFGPQNQANHMIMVQMAIISACESDSRSQDAAGFGKIPLCCKDGSHPRRVVSGCRVCISLSNWPDFYFFLDFFCSEGQWYGGAGASWLWFLQLHFRRTTEVCAGLCQPHWGGLWVLNSGR